jgi:hypothetical protein
VSITSSEKIFIDPKEEITFVVERVLSSQKERVILVIPLNSLLLSSIVSIQILFRKVVKSKKNVILVTEDEYGTSIGIKSGFVVLDKVSKIDSQQWQDAIDSKESAKEYLNNRKEELLKNITGQKEYIQEAEIDSTVEKEVVLAEDQVSELDSTTVELAPVVEDYSIDEEKAEALELERSLKPYSRPRLEAKEISVDGIQLISGGDIKSFIDAQESDKIESDYNNTNMSKEDEFDRKIRTTGANAFTGKDFTKSVSSKKSLGSIFSIFKRGKKLNREELDFTQKKKRKQIMLIAGGIFLFGLLITTYLFAFRFSTLDISIKLKAQDVSTSASVILSTQLTEATFSPVIKIPAKEYSISAENLSMSKTGTSDGRSKRGVKAKGVVTIYNLETNALTLPAGTKLRNLTNNLTYILSSDVALEPATIELNIKSPTSKDGIAIEAETFGVQYNIEVAEKTRFSIDGFNTEEELSATAFQSISGGTEEEFDSVSQANFDKLKDTIIPELKAKGLERLTSIVETGYKLIEQTVSYDESIKPSSIPAVSEESKDKTFNLTVQIGIKGLAVKTADLTLAIEQVLQTNAANNSSNSVKVGGITDTQIEKVEKNGEDYILTLSSKGSLTTQITADQIKKELSGLTMDQVKDYFRLIDYIEEYKVTFNPIIVPDFLKRVPSDIDRIQIRTR